MQGPGYGASLKFRRGARAQKHPEVLTDRLQSAYARYGSSARKRRAWASTNPGNRAAYGELMSAMRSVANEQLAGRGAILDVGCGTGGWVRELSQSVAPDRIHGIDAVANRVEEAQLATPGAHLTQADARALPFPDGQFVLVLLFTTLLDLPTRQHIAAVLGECQRVLAPGGLILIYEPRVPNPLNRDTRVVRRHDIALPVQSRTLTLLPPLARRLGRSTSALYPVLSAIPVLRTHRLWWYQKPARPNQPSQ
jgi:SAM-dependent methyltransferase